MDNEQRSCRFCGKLHDVFYQEFSNGANHLMMICDKTKKRIHIPYKSNLKIRTIKTKKQKKKEEEEAAVNSNAVLF